MEIEHFIQYQRLEFVTVNGTKTYLVNREREQIENIDDPNDVLPLVQRQVGRTPDGEWEIMERYCADGGEAVVIDASPAWLAELEK